MWVDESLLTDPVTNVTMVIGWWERDRGILGKQLMPIKSSLTLLPNVFHHSSMSGLDHTLPTNTVCSLLDLGHPGVGNRRENKNGSMECRRICEIKSSEYMS